MEPTANGSPTDPTEASNQSQDGTDNARSIRRFKVPGMRNKDSSNSQGSNAPSPDLGEKPIGDGHTSQLPLTERKLVSIMSLLDWRGDLTLFNGVYATLASESFEALSWNDFSKKVCPDEPIVVNDKKDATYLLPCKLRDAPLTGKTLELAQQHDKPIIGKMRSKDHVTASDVLLLDYDGMQNQDFERTRSFLEKNNLTYIAYTTFSHGMEGKQGMYVRLCIPVDRTLDAAAYTAAWNGFVALLPVAPDSSGSKLCQQQGIWTCHPDRKDKAQRWSYDGDVLNIDALPQRQGNSVPSDRSEPETPSPKTETAPSIEKYPPSDANRVAERCNQIRNFRDTKGAKQSEPDWVACQQAILPCVNGREKCHEWSSGHPDYSRTETDRKLDHLQKYGPTTCAQFQKVNPSGCEGCKENVKSPIVLGYEREEFTPEPMTIVQEPISSQSTGTKAKSRTNEDSTFTSGAGKTPFPIVEPCKDPVGSAAVCDEVFTLVDRHIVADAHQKTAIALWIAMTWFIDRIAVAPLLLITAAERESGKTQLLTVTSMLCRHPMTVANSTAAFLFRAISKWQPTLFIDEVDTFMRDSTDQKGLINAGHTRESAWVGRVVGDTHEPTMFPVFCPKALSGINIAKYLPDSTMSRGLLVELRRKLPDEKCERLRFADREQFKLLQSKLARFAQDNAERISNTRPTLPDALSDRQQDNWEPLFAIAECAGPEWLARCEEAALALSRAATLSEDTGNSLLSDIRDIFEQEECDKISSADLIEALIKDSEAGWSAYNRGKPLTPRQVAKLLKPYGIIPKTVRVSQFDTPKGYDRAQFEDAFARYLPEPALPEPDPADTLTPPPEPTQDAPPDAPEEAF